MPCPFAFASTRTPFLRNCLRSGDGLADLTATLPGVQSALGTLGGLLDDLGTLGEDELDVGGVGHVRVDLRAVRGEIEILRVDCWYVRDRGHGKCACAAWGPG